MSMHLAHVQVANMRCWVSAWPWQRSLESCLSGVDDTGVVIRGVFQRRVKR
jgi:hypothetical protein